MMEDLGRADTGDLTVMKRLLWEYDNSSKGVSGL